MEMKRRRREKRRIAEKEWERRKETRVQDILPISPKDHSYNPVNLKVTLHCPLALKTSVFGNRRTEYS